MQGMRLKPQCGTLQVISSWDFSWCSLVAYLAVQEFFEPSAEMRPDNTLWNYNFMGQKHNPTMKYSLCVRDSALLNLFHAVQQLAWLQLLGQVENPREYYHECHRCQDSRS